MKALSLEDAIASVTGESWDFVGAMEQRYGASPEARKKRELSELERKALLSAAASVFSGPDGERVLEWLLDQTWRRMTFAVMTHPDPQQALLYGAFREGQNALALSILRMIAEGRTETPPPQQE
ncbi:Bbp19 family protein [Kaistia sp. MMO-174]|uniref:Bbp19 family protein n=1 Tax=Kaistia sp. MMO-174 TaxID=3081256 RepID=UPI00301ADDD6